MNVQKTIRKTNVQMMYDTVANNVQKILIGLTILVACATILFGYQLWVVRREKAAQRDFGPLIAQYNMATQEKNPEWTELLKKFEKNYKKHYRSSLLPYYMEFKVSILLQQDKKEEAREVLNGIIADLSIPVMAPLLKMESALIALDLADAEVQKEGEEMLKKLAYDPMNKFRDTALFYLGRYYWSINQISAARDVWQQLVDEQRDEKIAPSPWVEHVENYLKLTIV
jgi:hypothetical protein